jgi:hypothetical protein
MAEQNLFTVNKSADPIPLAGMVGAADWVYQKILSSARYPIIGENELNADARAYIQDHEQQGKVRYSPVKQSSKASRIQPQNINYSLSQRAPEKRVVRRSARASQSPRRGVVSVPRDVELGCERGLLQEGFETEPDEKDSAKKKSRKTERIISPELRSCACPEGSGSNTSRSKSHGQS